MNTGGQGLLDHAWQMLEAHQKKRGGIYYSLLRIRASEPDIEQSLLIDVVEKQTGVRVKPGNIRVTLHRARQKFADFLLEAVAASLSDRTESFLEDELIALDLKKYCTEALQRREAREAD